MWHASICPRFSSVSFVLATLWEIAEHELRGVGDAALGEWREVGDVAVHLRRRLTDHEMRVGAIADVCDVRHTDEHVRRIERVRPFLPLSMQGIPADHLL